MKTLGIRLKELRLEKGLRQTDIATLLSVSLRQVQRYENDESDMSISTAVTLSEYFGVSIDYLTGRSDKRKC